MSPPSTKLLLLASSSPRRRALLETAGIDFRCVPPGPEPTGTGGPAERAQQRAAAKAGGAILPDGVTGLVLGVDTVVEVEGRELGKPAGRADAERMLRCLSDREHWVHTAHCLRDPSVADRSRSALASSRVGFRAIDDRELRAYLDSGAWSGKAGAYGIQDPGTDFAELRQGARDTVVGLHVAAVLQLLSELFGS